MNPGEIAIASRELIELRLLADPENAQRQKTHEIGEQAWQNVNLDQSVPQNLLGLKRPIRPHRLLHLNCIIHRDVKVEHKQRHRHSEDSVAQGSKSLQTLASDTVVIGFHWSSHRFQSNHMRSLVK